MGYSRPLAELTRTLFGITYIGGALFHLVLWTSNRGVYDEITSEILFGWYRDLWTGFVLPNLGFLVPLLAFIEVGIGVAILSKGRHTRRGLGLGTLFNICIAPLGYWWPYNVALAAGHLALLRFEYPETVLGQIRALIASKSGGS